MKIIKKTSSMKMLKVLTMIIVCSLINIDYLSLLAQEDSLIETIDLSQVDSDTKREEIQRYFGYETLLFRYLTLPYDTCLNVNQEGKFVDIGFLLIALLPIILIGLVYSKPKLFYALAFGLFLLLVLSQSYSHILHENKYYSAQGSEWKDFTNVENKNIIDYILTKTYSLSVIMVEPFQSFIENISEPTDSITYPVLLILLLSSLFFVLAKKSKRLQSNILFIIFIIYGFLWLVLSGGILWYGFLIIPFTLLAIGYYTKINTPNRIFKTYVKTLILSSLVLWSLLSIIGRVSNIDHMVINSTEHVGKTLLNGSIFPYSVGIFNDYETLNYTAPNLAAALDRINSDEALIFMIGTSYSFNIKNNINRIFKDNLLGTFYWLHRKYSNKNEIIEALKISDFKYIVVDLNTPTLDNTPEKSLTKKYMSLLSTLQNNPAVSLIATDRVVEFTDSNGNNQRLANIFGSRLVTPGSYAIYQIL